MHKFSPQSRGANHGEGNNRAGEASTGEGAAAADSTLRAGHAQRQPDVPILRSLSWPVLHLAPPLSTARTRRPEEPQVRLEEASPRDTTPHRGPHPPRPCGAPVWANPYLFLSPTLPSGLCIDPDDLQDPQAAWRAS